MIKGNDANNLIASNKLRLLLAELKISSEIPSGLENLIKYKKSEKDLEDALETFVFIRNSIVHSQSEKRKKLAKVPNMAKFEALQLGIWYVELLLLKILDHNGKYFNRCSKAETTGEREEIVPWAL